MKLTSWTLALLLPLTAVLYGCKEDEVAAAITPSADSASYFNGGITIPAAASNVTVKFTSTKPWSIVTTEETKALVSWLTITPASGNAGDVTAEISVLQNTALEARRAKVTIKSEDLSKDIMVTQAARDRVSITGITVDPASKEILMGGQFTVTATVIPSNTDDDKTVTWTTSDSKVATVRDGVVTAVSKGTASITASAGGKSASCAVTVTVVEVSGISLDKSEATLFLGETLTLKASVTPDDAFDKTITWTTSDESIATVDDGVVYPVAKGNATITAKAGDKTAVCLVSVVEKGSEGGDMDIDPTDPDLWN